MKEGPDISLIGSMIGDPARSNMLSALLSGKALTATELATEANITVQTGSVHLSKLVAAGMIMKRKQGRHRYFELTDRVVPVLESIMGLAADMGHLRMQTGPKDEDLRAARVCYDHIAGDRGVQIYDSMVKRKLLFVSGEDVSITDAGRSFVKDIGINLNSKPKSRRPLCLSCLDWSVRRPHLAGGLGAAILTLFENSDWARKDKTGGRVLEITDLGEKELAQLFPL